MSPDSAFTLANLLVMPAWLLLAVAPSWSYTQRLVHAIWIPLLLGAIYAMAFAMNPDTPPDANFSSLHGVMQLFTSPFAALAGSVHYLAFDLFVGAWEVRDAKRLGIFHLFLVPCLFLTLMLGPIGLVAYLLLRLALTRVWTLEEMGLDYELITMEFLPRRTYEGYLTINNLGTVPTLVEGDVTLTESTAMALYLAEKHGPTNLTLGPSDPDYGLFLNWLHRSDATLTFPLTLVLRYTRH